MTGRCSQKKVKAAKRKRLPGVLSDAEARAVVGSVRQPVARIAFLLMYACGLRISEAASLEVTAIDGRNGLIRVVGKGNKERSVPLPAPVLAELRRLWKAHGNRRWLCPNAKGDGPITRHALWQTFKKVRDETGIKAPASRRV